MGITNKLIPDEVTLLCNTVSEPNDTPGSDGLEDIDRFARFVRATKAPPRDTALAKTVESQEGSKLFDKIGCDTCHVRTLLTAPAGTAVNGGAFTVPDALGSKQFHPFGDFLLHDVGTGDGIAVAMAEHYGKAATTRTWMKFSYQDLQTAANKVRSAPGPPPRRSWPVITRSATNWPSVSLPTARTRSPALRSLRVMAWPSFMKTVWSLTTIVLSPCLGFRTLI